MPPSHAGHYSRAFDVHPLPVASVHLVFCAEGCPVRILPCRIALRCAVPSCCCCCCSLLLLLCFLWLLLLSAAPAQFSWPEFVAADLSKVTLKEALSSTSWDRTKRTMFIIEGLVGAFGAPCSRVVEGSLHSNATGKKPSTLEWNSLGACGRVKEFVGAVAACRVWLDCLHLTATHAAGFTAADTEASTMPSYAC